MAAPKKLLVTGGSGYLGRHLTAKAATHYNVYTTCNSNPDQIKAGRPIQLDLTNREAVHQTVATIQPEAIIHAAAINPGRGSAEAMMRVNGNGSRYMAEAAKAIGARFVYVSSDVIFDGKNAPYDDNASPCPLNDYGRSKAAGEMNVTQVDPTAAIARTSLIYGLEEMDRGTAGFAERLERGEVLNLFNDVIRQPVLVDTLSEALLRLIEMEYGGVLNVAGRQSLTREEFGLKMLAWWNVDLKGHVTSGRAADVSDTIPLDLRMRIQKAEQLLEMKFPGVDEVLAAAGKR